MTVNNKFKLVDIDKLQKFKQAHQEVSKHIDAWVHEIKNATWQTPHELKKCYPKASIIKNKNVIFDILGNRYRMWVQINYQKRIVLIKKIGTHQSYRKWIIK